MAALTIQEVGAAGNADVTAASSATSDTVALTNDIARRHGGHDLNPVLVLVTNGDASAHTVTVNGNAQSVAAGDTAMWRVQADGINDASITITSSAATSQTVSVVQLTD